MKKHDLVVIGSSVERLSLHKGLVRQSPPPTTGNQSVRLHENAKGDLIK